MNPVLVRAATLIAGAALAHAAQAESSVTAYGLMDMSVGQFQAAGGSRVWRADSGGMSTSHLGFRGSEDLGGGVRANFAIESFLRLDSGAAGRFGADSFWSRNAYVSLQGAFGQTRLGRNTTPLFVSTLRFNPFGDSFGFSPSIRHYFAGALLGDSAWNNSISFLTRNSRGVNFNLITGLGEGNGVGRNLGGNLVFDDGPLALTFAAQQVKNTAGALPAGFLKQDALQVGAAYNFGPVRLFGQFGAVETQAAANLNYKLYQLGAALPIGTGALLGSYARARTTSPGGLTRETLSLGYDHFLSKSTDVYAVFMNDQASGLATGRTLAGGLRLRF